MASEYKIAIKIAGQLESSLKNALNTATNSIKGLANTAGKVAVGAFAASGAAMVAMGKKAVDVGSEFESAMSQVAATGMIDRATEQGMADFTKLENAAREWGASTAFSATEAAEGLNELMLAGYGVEGSTAVLGTTLQLAGAGAMDLGAAAGMLTKSMNSLGMEKTTQDAQRLADTMAVTASSSGTTVAQLGDAIQTIGATAKGMAGGNIDTLTELNASLGILADAGYAGAEGGTHLRNTLLSLQNPTDDAAEALNNLGVSVYENGVMRDLPDIFNDLNTAMDGMNPQQIDGIMSSIFNKTDLAATRALLDTTPERWDELTEAIGKSAGACEQMYETQLDNLQGDLAKCSSAASDLGISAYKAMSGPLRESVQMATGWIGDLSAAFNDGGFKGLATEIGNVIAEAATEVAGHVPEFLSLAGDIVGGFVNGMTDHFPDIMDSAGNIVGFVVDGVTNNIGDVLNTGVDIVEQVANGITSNLDSILSKGSDLVESVITGAGEAVTRLIHIGGEFVTNVAQGLMDHAPELAAQAPEMIGQIVNGFISNLEYILQVGAAVLTMIGQGIVTHLPEIMQAGVQIVFEIGAGILSAISMIIDAAGSVVTNIWDTITHTDWLEVGKNIITAIGSGIANGAKAVGSAVKNAVVGFFGGGNDEAEQALSDLDNVSQSAPAGPNLPAVPEETNASLDAYREKYAECANAVNNEPLEPDLSGIQSLIDKTDEVTQTVSEMPVTTVASVDEMVMAFENGGGQLTTTVQGYSMKFTSAWSSVHGVIMSRVNATISAIQGAFAGMSITIPAPRLPHINVSQRSVGFGEGGSVTVPDFSVSYFANGGILTDPTMFGLNGMNPMVGGEAGPEAILPLDMLWTRMREIMTEVMAESVSVFRELLNKLKNGSGGNGRQMEVAGTGMTVNYAPHYTINGNVSKEDLTGAEKMSQEEFERMMRRWEKDKKRKKF